MEINFENNSNAFECLENTNARNWRVKNELGCGGGLVVSVLAFYSDDPSSIPAEVYNFFCKIVVEKNENKQKEAGVGPIFLKKRKQRADSF